MFIVFVANSTFPVKKMRPVEPNMFLKVTELHPEILQRILSTLLQVIWNLISNNFFHNDYYVLFI